MILWGLLIAGLLQSNYLFPFSLLYSPKPLHEPRVSLSTKELQTQSSAFQTLTQPHFASHKIPYQLWQRKKKKKKNLDPNAWITEKMKHIKVFSPLSSPTSQIQTHHSHSHFINPNSTPINQIRSLKSPLKYHTNPNKTHYNKTNKPTESTGKTHKKNHRSWKKK